MIIRFISLQSKYNYILSIIKRCVIRQDAPEILTILSADTNASSERPFSSSVAITSLFIHSTDRLHKVVLGADAESYAQDRKFFTTCDDSTNAN